jgi:C4-type Zn-finger protein
MLDSIHITCPYCGERFEALVDGSGGDAEYVEDCPVCCRPITLHLSIGDDGSLDGLDASRDD